MSVLVGDAWRQENGFQMTTTDKTTEGVQTLRPRARLMHTLGDELISSETVALLELVKNSFDADASHVLIRFHEPLEIGKGSIEIIDDGHGMSLDTVQHAWLEPATPTKKRRLRSESEVRRVLGEKGIGRFAAAKLAYKLQMVTRRVDEHTETRVEFDWRDFDSDTKYLDEVGVHWALTTPQDICSGGVIEDLWKDDNPPSGNDLYHGTVLRMSALRSAWSENQITDLRIALSRLISPFSKITDFHIFLSLPSPFENFTGWITSSNEFEHPHYTIKGNVTGDGKYNLKLSTALSKKVDSLKGEFKFQDQRQPHCGPFYIELRVWDRDNLANLAHEIGSSVKEIRRLLDNVAGINIYRDGFRILPYGEPDNDWLRLDIRRVQNPTLRLSNNQILGYVLITADANPELRDQSNREGLVEGLALNDLRELVKQVLQELETTRYKYRHPQGEKTQGAAKGIFSGFDLTSVQTLVSRKYPQDKELLELLSNKEVDLKARVNQVQEVLSQYRRLSALGELVDAVLHDGRTMLGQMMGAVTLGIHDTKRKYQRVEDISERIVPRFNTIKAQGEQMSALFRKLDPFSGRKRGKPATVSLVEAISNAFDLLQSDIKETGARISLPRTDIMVTVDSSEIGIVFINLLQNSLYWLRQMPKDKREIVVSVARNRSGEIEITFSDSGPGVPANIRGHIFNPYFSTKPDGIGLGLTIAGETIAEYYDGSLELLKSGPLPGATFKITLRKRI